MRALLIATGYRSDLQPLIHQRPTPLFCIADKPIIVHIIEYLVSLGVKHFDIVLHHLPEKIEECLENGQRWGIDLTYHLAREVEHPFSSVRMVVHRWPEDTIFLGQGDTLPILNPKDIKDHDDIPRLFFHDANQWTGWGIIPKTILETVSATTTLEQIPSLVQHDAIPIQPKLFFSTRTFADIQKNNQKLLSQKLPDYLMPTTAKMVEAGIWISRAVTLHPSTKISPPVFIGENCQINQGVILGPHTVIEANCFIDEGSSIKQSLVCQDSYVGQGLDVHHSIIDRHHLISLSLDTKVAIPDELILSKLSHLPIRRVIARFSERLIALALVALASPLLAFVLLRYPSTRKKVVMLPTSRSNALWKTVDWLTLETPSSRLSFFLDILVGLLNVVNGHAYFVGLKPRSAQELQQLPGDWQTLVLKGKLGLITLADIEYDKTPSSDELYASETYYVTHMGYWYDLKLCFKRLIRCLKRRINKHSK